VAVAGRLQAAAAAHGVCLTALLVTRGAAGPTRLVWRCEEKAAADGSLIEELRATPPSTAHTMAAEAEAEAEAGGGAPSSGVALRLRLSPRAFFQTSTAGAEVLYGAVAARVGDSGRGRPSLPSLPHTHALAPLFGASTPRPAPPYSRPLAGRAARTCTCACACTCACTCTCTCTCTCICTCTCTGRRARRAGGRRPRRPPCLPAATPRRVLRRWRDRAVGRAGRGGRRHLYQGARHRGQPGGGRRRSGQRGGQRVRRGSVLCGERPRRGPHRHARAAATPLAPKRADAGRSTCAARGREEAPEGNWAALASAEGEARP